MTSHLLKLDLKTEQDTQEMGEQIARYLKASYPKARHIKAPMIFYLKGDLGVGKTRLVRAVIQSLGYKGNVKSPTYTLVEPYEFNDFTAYHFDLYRLSDPEELDYLGIRDYFSDQSISFIEWADKGKGWLMAADIIINLKFNGKGRICHMESSTEQGHQLLESIKSS